MKKNAYKAQSVNFTDARYLSLELWNSMVLRLEFGVWGESMKWIIHSAWIKSDLAFFTTKFQREAEWFWMYIFWVDHWSPDGKNRLKKGKQLTTFSVLVCPAESHPFNDNGSNDVCKYDVVAYFKVRAKWFKTGKRMIS